MSYPFRCVAIVLFAATVLLTVSSYTLAQDEQREQVVARVKLSSPNNKENPVFAEAGDVLELLQVKDGTALVQSAAGRRANVRVQDVTELSKARGLYDDLIKADPKNGSLYASRALVRSIEDDKPQVIADLSKALALGLKTPTIYINRGAAFATSGEYDRAIADYDLAIKGGYDQAGVYINRGVAYFAKGDVKKASEDFTRALAKDPKNEFVLMQRGIAFQRQQQWDNAIADFTALMKLNPKNIDAISSRGFTQYLKGNSQAAVDDFSLVIKLNPESALAYNNRGFNRQVIGKYKEAIADYDKAAELAPKYALAYQNKAWLLATCPDDKIRDGKVAIEAATKAGELREWKAITDIKSLAAAYAEVGDFDKAVQWQQKAVDMAEGDSKSGEQEMLKLYKAKAPFRFAAPAPK